MDVRFLPQPEFDNVHFYRAMTLLILLAMAAFTLIKMFGGAIGVFSGLPLFLLLLGWRFAVEWRRVSQAEPAFIDKGELVLCGKQSHRQIALERISSVRSRHSLFMVRRYRSWSEHLGFVEFTLNDGERVSTLAESQVFERPAASGTLAAIEAAILEAKVKRQASEPGAVSGGR
ncbi:hypothetical protein N5C93_29915 [Pseudomonas nitroreducens]|uniref:hypothetical protein n=1 Tax=Pseudomonas TaxID=286 RepID=UPI00055D4C3A|nr:MULTISPECIES: hypothetical protein [Pseudomonas]MDG9855192.1 hypothetical protein [Pseudomonas nitroreducens]MDH1077059.1 hypothetical protein [Pseudomonas nitroreducens]NMZ73228.1 hypothetical protein [Pseudomonas nitroreducens]NNN27288.1 hypothetical protein [Pseudomonas nitroreducens]UCL88982.1 hypothetical protein LDJ84_09880 [Pseudomonas sp. HS-18]